jgi:hypothetical protein
VGATEWTAANSVDFSPGGNLLAVGSRDGWVRLYDFKKQTLLKECPVVRFSPDGPWLAAYRLGWATPVLWDLADPQNPRKVWLETDEIVALHPLRSRQQERYHSLKRWLDSILEYQNRQGGAHLAAWTRTGRLPCHGPGQHVHGQQRRQRHGENLESTFVGRN